MVKCYVVLYSFIQYYVKYYIRYNFGYEELAFTKGSLILLCITLHISKIPSVCILTRPGCTPLPMWRTMAIG